MNSACKKILGAGAMALAATPALAHTGGPVSGLGAGITHPVLGLDHLLAMGAVGFWSAAEPARMARFGPLAFLGFLAVGALIGASGTVVPFVEPGVLASVIVFGLIIAAVRLVPAAFGLGAVSAFALLHGHVHGVEAIGSMSGYMTGFMLSSATLIGAGFGAGCILARGRNSTVAAGLAIVAGGLALAGA